MSNLGKWQPLTQFYFQGGINEDHHTGGCNHIALSVS